MTIGTYESVFKWVRRKALTILRGGSASPILPGVTSLNTFRVSMRFCEIRGYRRAYLLLLGVDNIQKYIYKQLRIPKSKIDRHLTLRSVGIQRPIGLRPEGY